MISSATISSATSIHYSNKTKLSLQSENWLDSTVTQVIAIANAGDTTDHTTAVVSLAGALATDGLKVLIIEANVEAPISTYFRLDEVSEPTLADIFQDGGIVSKDQFTTLASVSDSISVNIIAAGKNIEQLASGLGSFTGKGLLLTRLVTVLHNLYDYVLISCGRNLDVLLVNALAASTTLVIPASLGNIDAEALKQYLKIVTMVEAGKKVTLRKIAVPIARGMEAATSEQQKEELKSLLGDELWEGVIPTDPLFERAAERGTTISELNPKAPGAVGYRRLSEALAE